MNKKFYDWLSFIMIIAAIFIFASIFWNVFHYEKDEPLDIPAHVAKLPVTAPKIETEPPVKLVVEQEPEERVIAIPLPSDLQTALYEACDTNGVPLHIGLGLIEVESCFVEDADNGLCYGLCQLSRQYFPDNLSPADNIRYGMEYLGNLLKQYGNTSAALVAYNQGSYKGILTEYAKNVLNASEKWCNIIYE